MLYISALLDTRQFVFRQIRCLARCKVRHFPLKQRNDYGSSRDEHNCRVTMSDRLCVAQTHPATGSEVVRQKEKWRTCGRDAGTLLDDLTNI